ncbi:MAG TPA: hypothetical protein VKP65_10340 [Rhodothermales bacterium]|nr:hypothetical protein [Rhodothermales bacterium]
MIDPLSSTAGIACLRVEEIQHAVQHHERALASLHGITFESLSDTKVQRLLEELTAGLRLLKEELARRGLDGTEANPT